MITLNDDYILSTKYIVFAEKKLRSKSNITLYTENTAHSLYFDSEEDATEFLNNFNKDYITTEDAMYNPEYIEAFEKKNVASIYRVIIQFKNNQTTFVEFESQQDRDEFFELLRSTLKAKNY